MEFEAAGNHIIVKEVKQDEGTTLVLPNGVSSGKGMSSEVVIATIESVGSDINLGLSTPEKGTQVLVATYAGVSYSYNNDLFKVIHENDILAYLN